MEYRFPVGSSCQYGRDGLSPFVDADLMLKISSTKIDPLIWDSFRRLTICQVSQLRQWVNNFLEYELHQASKGVNFDYGDASLGNIFFGGCYLSVDRNFNAATEIFSNFCALKSKVLNITNGDNYVLVALKDGGEFMHDESSIVSPQDSVPISEIFLLQDYLSEATQSERKKIIFKKK
jgi:2-phospho-L-lactate transferase/gluconeogenesis factor (CofD/UPF0052 family)